MRMTGKLRLLTLRWSRALPTFKSAAALRPSPRRRSQAITDERHRSFTWNRRIHSTSLLSGLAILIVSLVLAGCVSTDRGGGAAGTDRPAGGGFRPGIIALTANLVPAGGIPRFFGASPRLGKRNKELSIALEAAAEQASRFLRLEGRLFLYQTNGSAGTLLQHQVEVSYNKKAVTPKDLKELNSYQDDTGTYVVASLPTASMPTTTWPGGLAVQYGKRPSWVDSPPKMPGYLTAIGVAERRRWIADSIQAADESAVGELVRQLSVKLQSGAADRQIAGVGSSSSAAVFERAAARLRDFYVLARWATPNGSTWYSLAIASKASSSALPLEPIEDGQGR